MKTKLAKITLGTSLAIIITLATLIGCATVMPSTLSTQAQTQPTIITQPDDPVVFTTQSGIQIKKTNSKISGSKTIKTNRGSTLTQNLSDYYYFTMGTYSGTILTQETLTASYTISSQPINWLIIGRGKLSPLSSALTENEINSPTPAGTHILSDSKSSFRKIIKEYGDITYNPEIPDNCILVYSEALLGRSVFNAPTSTWDLIDSGSYNFIRSTSNQNQGNRYRYISSTISNDSGAMNWNNKIDGTLYTAINNLFSKNASTGAVLKNTLNFPNTFSSKIRPQQLYTYYNNGATNYGETPSTDGGTYYSMFPLAGTSPSTSITQNFCFDTYMTETNAYMLGSYEKLGYYLSSAYWLRSGAASTIYSHSVQSKGVGCHGQSNNLNGIRPAFIMDFSEDLVS